MYSALTALLANTIDYAGTFPPAELPLHEALKKMARFRREGNHPWLLHRMALPLGDIEHLSSVELLEAGADGSRWLFTALGGESSGELDERLPLLRSELDRIRLYNQARLGESVEGLIVSYETKQLVAHIASDEQDFLKETIDQVAEAAANIRVYFEVPLEGSWRAGLSSLVQALRSRSLAGGVKIRTGGERLPSAGELAYFLHTVIETNLAFKATQGLHHPFSQPGQFGFINLMAAASLAGSGVGLTELATALVDDASEFRFEKAGFWWREVHLLTNEIERARRVHRGCFGSCSLDEPDQFLAEILPLTGE